MNDPITWQEITVTLGDIVPWAENPRYSTKAEARRILKSLDQFGQAKPINLSPTNDLYDGHQRLSALLTIKGNGHKIKAWQSSRHLTAEERKQFVLSLHEGAVGQWNFEELGNWEPELLATYGFDTDALDQTRREMAFLIEMLGEGEGEEQVGEEGDAEPQVDKAAELQAEWGTEVGQLWHIGEHRLLIGDCTVRENVERLMGGDKADIGVHDPPYGINADKSMHEKGGQQYGNAAAPKRHYSETDWDSHPPDKSALEFIMGVSKKTVFWGGNYFDLPPSRCYLVWDKENGDNQFADCELAWTNLDKPVRIIRHLWNGMLRKDKEARNVHPTQKPLGVISWAIQECGDGDLVVDFYVGSGTTMVAAHNLGRKCYGMELSPAYGAVILQRMITAFPDIDIYKAE